MELLVNLYDRLGTRCSLFKEENAGGSRYVLERIVAKKERDCIELIRALHAGGPVYQKVKAKGSSAKLLPEAFAILSVIRLTTHSL